MKSFDRTDWKRRIGQCLIRDRVQFDRDLKKIESRLQRKQPVDNLCQRLDERIKRSRSVVELRQSAQPAIEYPQELPVSRRQDEILKALQQHQVIIVAGETGSGKTTQIPKMCLQAGLGLYGLIGHTQPRRLAARSVCQRIADELGTPLGDIAGYKIRFQDNLSDSSQIKLMTDGILLAEINHDRFLSQYSVLILDEAHERSLNIDFLMGYLKQLLPKRPDLKVIVTSATIDHWRFSRYFDDAPVIEVSGRTYPVDIKYCPLEEAAGNEEDMPADDESRLETGIIQAVNDILKTEREHPSPGRPGDILVFLASERDIRQVADRLRKSKGQQLEVLPLYSRLSNQEQNRIFEAHHRRRIVLSTNVAETSITVPGIGYVIDAGVARISRYSYRSKVQRLPIEPVSRASANQRSGRCGRVAEGVCYRLYSEEDFLKRPEFTEPEILRTNLSSVILQMQGLKLGELSRFPLIDPPDNRLINDGYRLLEELDAIDEKRTMTSVGSLLLRFPVDPRIARMLVAAGELDCLREMLVICSGLSVQEPWQRPHDQRQAADEALSRFRHEDSDFLTFLNVWAQCEQTRAENSSASYRRWLVKNFLSYLRIREWQDVYRQLKQACHELGWKENREPARYEEIHKALLAGLLSHVAQKDDQQTYKGTRNRTLSIFPGSGQHKRKPKWLLCAEIVETQKVYGRTVARIEPEWVEKVGQRLLKRNYFEPHWEKKRAAAMAWEQTSLFGLVVTPRKPVNFSSIDPVLSREIFIRNALVLQDYDTRAPWAKHNRELVESLEYLEQKTRRRDILVDEESLYAVFDERIPAQVVNGKSFEHWRKQAEQKDPHILFLQREQLIASEDDGNSQWAYPDQVEVEGGRIEIDYQFEPGKERDGLNIRVPIALLNQVEEEKLEWLVPGLEKEKCIALIKSLPKALRKHFVPAPDFVDAFLASKPDRNRSLLAQLTQFLRQKKNVDIHEQSWDESSLPLYLRANLQVVDEKGKELQHGRDIRSIKAELQGEFQQSIQHLTRSTLDRETYDHWAFGDIPEVYEAEQGGAKVKVYPALVDQTTGARLELFESAYAAGLAMQKGVLRLCILAMPKQVRYLKKQQKLPESVAMQYSAFGGRQSLEAGYIEAVFRQACLADAVLPRTEAGFAERLAIGNGKMGAAANEVATLIGEILHGHHRVLGLLGRERSPARLAATQDILSQLDRLFPQNWLQVVPMQALRDYPRYLQGVEVRWDRLQGRIEKDREQAEEIETLWQQYLERKQKHQKESIQDEALDQWRWALEEYRLSVFAQGIKTAYPVSYKRLQKMWQNVSL